jgi:hypothetical protein
VRYKADQAFRRSPVIYPYVVGIRTVRSRRFGEENCRTRQNDSELSEFARLRIDLNGAAMLLDDDVVADGETEAGAFASGLRCKEWIEYLFLHLQGHTSAIVADPDFHTVAEVLGGRYKGWLVIASIRLCTALGRRVEAI